MESSRCVNDGESRCYIDVEGRCRCSPPTRELLKPAGPIPPNALDHINPPRNMNPRSYGAIDDEFSQMNADLGSTPSASPYEISRVTAELCETSSPVSTLLPQDPAARKGIPLTTGVLDYFPKALAYVAIVSKAGNDQHNPGQPLHWARGKSTDHADCIGRHLVERGTRDGLDNLRHSGKMAWRSLANLELELEAAEKNGEPW